MHTHPLSSSWKPDESFICSLNTSVTHSSFRPNDRKREERGAHDTEAANKTTKTAVTGRSTYLSRSSHQWHLLGNWGCQSASPAELLCSSCSSPTEPLQNRQRTKPPETSGRRGWRGETKQGLYITMHRSMRTDANEHSSLTKLSHVNWCFINWEETKRRTCAIALWVAMMHELSSLTYFQWSTFTN